MPSAAPISGVEVVRVDTVSLGGTVKERVIAIRRGVTGSGGHGVAGEEFDIAVVLRVVSVGDVYCSRDSGSTAGRLASGKVVYALGCTSICSPKGFHPQATEMSTNMVRGVWESDVLRCVEWLCGLRLELMQGCVVRS